MTEEQIAYCRSLGPESLRDLPFRKQIFPDVSNTEIAAQAALQQAALRKLPPAWLEKNLFLPDRQAVEQCTTALVAGWKKSLVPPETTMIADACAGLGVDAFFLSEFTEELFLYENHSARAAALRINAPRIREKMCSVTGGELRETELRRHASFGKKFLLYADPDRRDGEGRRLRGWEQFRPDIRYFLEILKNSGSGMLLKLSPLEDAEELASTLSGLKAVYLVSVHNEVKEVLFHFDFSEENSGSVGFEAVELRNSGQVLRVKIPVEKAGRPLPGLPQKGMYLLDPLASLRKGRFAACMAEAEGWKSLSVRARLFLSDSKPANFPGRLFRIEGLYDSPSHFRKDFTHPSCHVVARDFPADAGDIRKKLRLKEEGDHFLFCFRDDSGKKMTLHCLREPGKD